MKLASQDLFCVRIKVMSAFSHTFQFLLSSFSPLRRHCRGDGSGGNVGGSDHGSGVVDSDDSDSHSDNNDERGNHAGENNDGNGMDVCSSRGDEETILPAVAVAVGWGGSAAGVAVVSGVGKFSNS